MYNNTAPTEQYFRQDVGEAKFTDVTPIGDIASALQAKQQKEDELKLLREKEIADEKYKPIDAKFSQVTETLNNEKLDNFNKYVEAKRKGDSAKALEYKTKMYDIDNKEKQWQNQQMQYQTQIESTSKLGDIYNNDAYSYDLRNLAQQRDETGNFIGVPKAIDMLDQGEYVNLDKTLYKVFDKVNSDQQTGNITGNDFYVNKNNATNKFKFAYLDKDGKVVKGVSDSHVNYAYDDPLVKKSAIIRANKQIRDEAISEYERIKPNMALQDFAKQYAQTKNVDMVAKDILKKELETINELESSQKTTTSNVTRTPNARVDYGGGGGVGKDKKSKWSDVEEQVIYGVGDKKDFKYKPQYYAGRKFDNFTVNYVTAPWGIETTQDKGAKLVENPLKGTPAKVTAITTSFIAQKPYTSVDGKKYGKLTAKTFPTKEAYLNWINTASDEEILAYQPVKTAIVNTVDMDKVKGDENMSSVPVDLVTNMVLGGGAAYSKFQKQAIIPIDNNEDITKPLQQNFNTSNFDVISNTEPEQELINALNNRKQQILQKRKVTETKQQAKPVTKDEKIKKAEEYLKQMRQKK